MKRFIKLMGALVALAVVTFTCSLQAKGAEDLAGIKPPTNAKPPPSKAKVFRSHVKQIGNIGPAEVYAVKVQSFHGPTLSSALLFNPKTEEFLILGTAVDNGIAKSLLGAGAQVGSAYLWGSSLRPNKQTINNGSLSASGAVSSSKSTGGNAVSVSDADASNRTDVDVKNDNDNTNVNANTSVQGQQQGQAQGQLQGQQQGQQQNQQSSGFTPPGQVNNPGHNGGNH